MSDTGTVQGVTGWTMDTLQAHYAALRKADQAFEAERDRRYSEVNTEREKALKIKETADLAALGLAREIQTYKDEKANELREQINAERNLYVTKDELASAIRELQASGRQGGQWIVTTVVATLAVLIAFGSVIATTLH
jgi:hypothetical protein